MHNNVKGRLLHLIVAVGRKAHPTGSDLTAPHTTDTVTAASAPLPERNAFFLSPHELTITMKYVIALAFFTSVVMLSGCSKKKTDVAEQAPSATSPPRGTSSPESATPQQSATPAASAEPSPDDAERAKKLALLDYATMEDQYINDPHAQWATSASASSTFGDDRGTAAEGNQASNVIGPVDGKNWTNNHQDIGFDWLQVGFDKTVFATEIRVVFVAGQGAEAVTKLEVQDAQGQWVTVWSGLSDVKTDERGDRTWFVHKFDKTKTPTKAARITIANNVQHNYKVVDAVQLVGE